MAKRTMEDISKDYKACKKYVDEHPNITSLKEVAEALGLTVHKVETSFSRHPRIFKGIKNQIASNLESLKAQKKAQKEAEKEAQRKAKQEALEAKKKAEAKRKAEQENHKAQTPSEVKKPNFVGFVIDASISGIDNIMDTLNKICVTKSKIILTSVTIKELEQMQRFHDNDGNDARKILAMAAGDYTHFECVLIDETIGTPDDCIIKYCADNKDNVVLLTSDKTMDLKARSYGIKTHFFKHSNKSSATLGTSNGIKIRTLYAARKVGSKLIISDFGNAYKSIRVISDGIEYNSGIVELKIGDDVYIAAAKSNYVTFAHYKIVSLSLENNCTCVYYRRLYDLDTVNDLPDASYKAFMRDFKCKVMF